MGGLIALGFESARQIGPLWTGLILAVLIFVSVFAAISDHEDMKRATQIRTLAQEAWMSDCRKPVDECFAAWDDGYSLRKFYAAKIEQSLPR